MKWLALSLFLLLAAAPAYSQPAPPLPEKIEALTTLLQDPEVQSWIKRAEDKSTPPPKPSSEPLISTWETAIRARMDRIAAAIPRIPTEVLKAAKRVRGDAVSNGYAPVFLMFFGLILVGMIVERLYLRMRSHADNGVYGLLSVFVFALPLAIIFFAVHWPPLVRVALLVYLIAFVGFRLASALVVLAVPREGLIRAQLLVGAAVLATANSVAGSLIGIDQDVVDALSYLSSILLLALLLEAVWSVRTRSLQRRFTLTFAIVVIWALWCLGLKGLFWIGFFALILPATLQSVGKAALRLVPNATGMRSVLITRGARAAIIVVALAWLVFVWKMNPEGLAQRDPALSAVFYGLLKSVAVVLVADLLWHMAKSWIDGQLVTSDDAGLTAQETSRRGRLRTLLPILRNALAAVGLTITVLLVLAELGVEIGPLIAGAGVFGVAIGFGSQTLVKDVISGVFYMLDDAFRVGEYIQAKSYKGTVEGFSLRSVRLRHHRGPIFTVPFGELGAVENMSRDWGVVKFRISVGFDADVEKARKLTKKIGATMLEDPEFGPIFIEPLKMKGVEEFGDYGMVLSFGMTLKPSPMQSFIRRRANLLLREAFVSNGIQFAQPTVNVGGEGAAGNASAAALQALNKHTQLAATIDGSPP
ncbi:mechanosensitive ion channel family protein [Agrobacterium sp. Ap1]|jgi:small-conductance mechanosensitive channel|uniref:mechanosensitive ion channel family protein n=1 Tax=Rhizobium/Agrobacterium group TaxID=227290 RepID=UPI001A8E90D1|nr:mechanosensitive ion channel family protein [Agrobacterium sp. Ap1]MBO0143589.1 mechanosensitive ion channel family protein [Agrobacterium sp. Ap1]